jgi:hypothetical protein
VIVNAVEGRRGNLKAKAGAEIASGDVIVGFALNAAIFEAGCDGLAAAAVDADAAAGQRRAAFGSDVDDVRRPYCAGSAPVSRPILPMKEVSNSCEKPDTPSGSRIPLIRY